VHSSITFLLLAGIIFRKRPGIRVVQPSIELVSGKATPKSVSIGRGSGSLSKHNSKGGFNA